MAAGSPYLPVGLNGCRVSRVGRAAKLGTMIEAVVFDLDGVLVDSEQLWDQARREVAAEHAGRWQEQATTAMQGMSSPEWSGYMRDSLGVTLSQEEIADLVVQKLLDHYEQHLPLLPGAAEAVRRIGSRWPLALASSANRPVIDKVLDLSGLRHMFQTTVSSEEVAHGKPEPDVYLEAAHRLHRPPRSCVAVEDSTNGIRAAVAAGLRTVAIPNPHYPPPLDALRQADVTVENLTDLTVDVIDRLAGLDRRGRFDSRLDEEEIQSFPASDPHSDWAGPPD